MKAEIEVDNINCNGCAATILKELMGIEGIESVSVDLADKLVNVDYREPKLISVVKQKLASLGYPERGSVHGFSKATTKAKSLVSCAIGKLS
ncbi:MAG: heavy-metal-associated domain-containing protein [Bacteroidota bacterium]